MDGAYVSAPPSPALRPVLRARPPPPALSSRPGRLGLRRGGPCRFGAGARLRGGRAQHLLRLAHAARPRTTRPWLRLALPLAPSPRRPTLPATAPLRLPSPASGSSLLTRRRSWASSSSPPSARGEQQPPGGRGARGRPDAEMPAALIIQEATAAGGGGATRAGRVQGRRDALAPRGCHHTKQALVKPPRAPPSPLSYDDHRVRPWNTDATRDREGGARCAVGRRGRGGGRAGGCGSRGVLGSPPACRRAFVQDPGIAV
jgi:hypothetical protein